MDIQQGKANTEVKYNLGSDQLKLIGMLMAKSSRHYLEGDLGAWFNTLKAIKLKIIARLTTQERTELAILENRICMNYHFYRKGIEGYRTKTMAETEQYEILLMEKLELKGFLIPLKQDTTNLFGQGPTEELD